MAAKKVAGKAIAAGKRLAAVDTYIAKAAPFAQPILHELREVFHEGAPGVVEEIKWSRPFFVYEGVILGNISAFKAHCSLGLWGTNVAEQLRADGVASSEGMGSFGRITAMAELPARRKLVAYVRDAAAKIATGERTKAWARPRVVKAEPEVPETLALALKTNKAALAKFATMTPGCRREYCAWIAEAKQQTTRDRRASQAVEMIAEGKSRNWKYESC